MVLPGVLPKPQERSLSDGMQGGREGGDDALLNVRGVSLRYGGVAALTNVEFDVRQGSIHALVGPNGAGKTSLLDVLTGVAQPSGGSVRLGTQDLLQVPSRKRGAAGCARSFQSPALVEDLNVSQNVQLGLRIRSEHRTLQKDDRQTAVETAMTSAGLPRELWTMFPGDLSGGHQKLVDLARALAAAPDLLLLDEPTSGVTDDESIVLAGAVVRAAQAGCSVLVIDHNVAFVRRIAEHVTVLDHGSVIADGATEDVLSRSEVVEAFVGAETNNG